MKELFCLRCGYKEAIHETGKNDHISKGWMLQFNGLICPACDEKYPHKDRKQFT